MHSSTYLTGTFWSVLTPPTYLKLEGLKLTTPSYLLTMLENGNPICFLSSLYTDMSILGIDGCNSMFLR